MRRMLGWCVSAFLLAGAAACGGGGAAPPTTSGAAPAVSPGPGQHALTLDHGGLSRSYRLHAPPGYAPAARPVPLVIALHPYPGTGLEMSQLFGWDSVAEREGFLVAYPDGVDGGFNAMACCGNADDVGFLAALTGHLVDTWHVDPDRVYLTGISNGGDLSFRAAVEAGGTFAAIGVVSGGFIGERTNADEYAPQRPVSVVTFIGERDRYALPFRTGIDRWRQRLGCTPVTPPPAAPAEDVTLSRARCADGSDLDVYLVGSMGHSWPGASGDRMSAPEVEVNATELIWTFFAAHPRRT